jgi:dipeptidyl aminopeptidase/acylaminoacyl peptidase
VYHSAQVDTPGPQNSRICVDRLSTREEATLVTSDPFHFVSSERPLTGTLARPDADGAPLALLCHGFGSHDDDVGAYERLAARLAAQGFASLRFSFSGSDPYPDKGTIRPASEWVYDCLAAISAAGQAEGVDASRLGLVGLSIGGGVVIQAAALCPDVTCVVALAPVADGRWWLRHRWMLTRGEAAWREFVARVEEDERRVVRGEPSEVVPHFDVQAFPDEAEWNAVLDRYPRLLREMTLASVADTFRFRPMNYVQDIAPRPLRIVHGDADESVPLEQAYTLYGRAGEVKDIRIVRDAPHCCWDTEFEEEEFRLTEEWLGRYLS